MNQLATRAPAARPGATVRTESARSLAWTGALLGTAGLFMLNLVLGPLAIGLGVTAMRRGVRPGAPRVAALASICLGVADVLLEIVLVAFSFGHGGMVWHFGA